MLPWTAARGCEHTSCYDHVSDLESFSETMKDLYLRIRGGPEICSFEDLEAQTPIRIVCKNTTASKNTTAKTNSSPPRFNLTSPDVENVIKNSEKLKVPEKPSYIKLRTDREWVDDSWAHIFEGVLEDAQDVSQMMHPRSQCISEPSFWDLRGGVGYVDARAVLAYLYRHNKAHWTSYVENTCMSVQKVFDKDPSAYFIRGELLPVFATFYGQTVHSKVDRNADEDFFDPKYLTPSIKYKGGKLTATVVSCKKNHARVIQATCDPSLNENVVVHLNLRAHYRLHHDADSGTWDKESVQNILRWILATPEYPHDSSEKKSSWEGTKPNLRHKRSRVKNQSSRRVPLGPLPVRGKGYAKGDEGQASQKRGQGSQRGA
ncbi:hypothetical protein KEM55_003238 [Ascosphaera atra]|nr:hypothetical protein KEM55_003238 [Ascosphaera atra]